MTLESLLAGDPTTVTRLHQGEEALWRRLLLEHLAKEGPSTHAPAGFVRAAFDVDDTYRGWSECAARAADAIGVSSDRPRTFRRWFFDGVEAHPPREVPALLSFRLEALPEVVDLAQTEALVRDIAVHAPRTLEHGRALLLATRRRRERDDHPTALELARKGEAVFAALGADASAWVREARLQRAGALVHLESFDEALTIVEAEVPGPLGRLLPKRGGAFMSSLPSEPRARARAELADITAASVYMKRGAAYVSALGAVAERYADASLGDTTHGAPLWARFEDWLDLLGEEDPDELERVAEQARDRGLERVAGAAATWRSRQEAMRQAHAETLAEEIVFPYERAIAILPYDCPRCHAELYVGVTDRAAAEESLDASERTRLAAAREARNPFGDEREPDLCLSLEFEALEKLGERMLPFATCPGCGQRRPTGEAADEPRFARAASLLCFDHSYILEKGRLTTRAWNRLIWIFSFDLEEALEGLVGDPTGFDVVAPDDVATVAEALAEVLVEHWLPVTLRRGHPPEDVDFARSWLERRPEVRAIGATSDVLFTIARDWVSKVAKVARRQCPPR